ncbi:hypothetical protein FH972_006698 [Carpinus fangiana]|uniref:Peptide chain release factor domain-containing protein n=1 Tax=Carpinus fangiana TaxID=176857 RepID=A0A5N6QU51_9ROSI|nr:hypothetical protein FH972_006698 [Carpinus fangiana]
MSFLILRKSLRSSKVSTQNPRISFLFSYGSPSFSYKTTEAPPGSRRLSHLIPENPIPPSGSPIYRHSFSGIYSNSLPSIKNLSQFRESPIILKLFRYFGTEAAELPSTADGLTVEGILASNWTILDESESDWKSHAAAIAQSIHLIKKRLKWKKLVVRLDLLSMELNKPDLWDDPVHAGKISREHGSLMGKMKQVRAFERELLEHIDMIKLAGEENDADMESESLKALVRMRRNSKEKELQAMLAGEQDSCSCYIEVQAGAGGTESMDWAAMVMQMYKMWAQKRGYKVTVVDEMPGEMAGIKVHLLTSFHSSLFSIEFIVVSAHPLILRQSAHTHSKQPICATIQQWIVLSFASF